MPIWLLILIILLAILLPCCCCLTLYFLWRKKVKLIVSFSSAYCFPLMPCCRGRKKRRQRRVKKRRRMVPRTRLLPSPGTGPVATIVRAGLKIPGHSQEAAVMAVIALGRMMSQRRPRES